MWFINKARTQMHPLNINKTNNEYLPTSVSYFVLNLVSIMFLMNNKLYIIISL